jgi:glutaredoxin
MNKKIIIPTILFFIVLIFSFVVLSQEKNKKQSKTNEPIAQENQQIEQSQIILFYGDGCPHCAKVEEYFKENNVKEKISFVEKEVYYNLDNAKELEDKAKICGLPTDSIGVPFLWAGEKCLVGDGDIINFFKQKTNGQ